MSRCLQNSERTCDSQPELPGSEAAGLVIEDYEARFPLPGEEDGVSLATVERCHLRQRQFLHQVGDVQPCRRQLDPFAKNSRSEWVVEFFSYRVRNDDFSEEGW